MATVRPCCLLLWTSLALSCAHDAAFHATPEINSRVSALHLPQPTSSQPVAAAALIEPVELSMGRDATIFVVVRTAPGWHIYPLDAENTARSTTLTLDAPRGIEPAGDWEAPAPGPGPDGPAYAGQVMFAQRVRVSAAAAAGAQVIRCAISFHACDISNCRPPQTMLLEAAFDIAAAD